jgi:hypothetical protein
MFRDDSIESPREKARRLKLTLIPKRGFQTSSKEPNSNPTVAVCGECGECLKRIFVFTCKDSRCPIRPTIRIPEERHDEPAHSRWAKD